MLAATICSSVGSPAARREKRLLRGSTETDARVGALHRRLDDHPIANGGKIDTRRRMVAKAAGDAREPLARCGKHPVDVRVLERNAGRHQPFGFVRSKRSGKLRRPSQCAEIDCHQARRPRRDLAAAEGESPTRHAG